MIWRVVCFSASVSVGIAGCGGNGAPAAMPDPTAGTIAGTVNGTTWTTLSNAWWAGRMVAGSPPVLLFLFEAPVACSEIVNLNWDKTATGARQILEFGLLDKDVRAHQIMTDAFASYLLGNYNPDAFSGTVTITAVNPQANLTGSFDLNFLPDVLTGTFDAKWCPNGQEP